MSKKGFTLIETIVALAVIFAALSGPVTLVVQSFVTVKFAKNKLTAAYLAEEGLELIRAIRENNMICRTKDSSWSWRNSGATPTGVPELHIGASWRISHTFSEFADRTCGPSGDQITVAYPLSREACVVNNPTHRLKIDSEGRYGYSGTDSIFTRCVNVTQPTADETLPTGIIPRDDILDVISTVTWQERGKTKTFELRERLYNWE